MMSPPGRDWRVVLLAIASGGSGMLALAIAVAGSAYGVLERLLGQQETKSLDPLDVFLLSGALTLIGTLMFVASYHALQVLRGHPDRPFTAYPLRIRDLSILMLVWLASAILAQILVDRDPWRWATPFLHLLAIGTPVYLLVRLAIGGVRGGSRLRLWGTLATGLILGTGLAAVTEIALLILAVSMGTLYLVLNPEQLLTLASVAQQLGQTSGMEDALMVMQPLLVHPVALLVVVLAVSVITPIVEELAKSAAAWVIYDRLSTAAHGFWCGAVSGAGFAVFEGLMASANTSGSWSFILLIRAGSSMMHILASAMAGWGIAAFRHSRRPTYLLGGYAIAIGLHALWNTSVVAIIYGGLRSAFSGNQVDVVGLAAVAAGAVVLAILLSLLPVMLIVINRRLRSHGSAPTQKPLIDGGDTAPSAGVEG